MEWLEPRLLLTAQIAYAAIDPPGSVGTESSAVSGSDASAEPTSPPAFVSSATKPPPVVKTSAGARAFMENAPALVIDPAITVTDAGSTTLAGATVTISGNYADGEDVLAFASEYGITGSWDADSGVLTLWGAASLASYQAALRSVTYVDTSTIPSMLTRTISFVTDDGGATDNLSNAATRAVTMSYIDLTGTLGSPWTLPSAVVAGKALAGFTPVVVKNIGDVAVPAGQLVNIQVVAQDTATGAQIALTTLKNQSVSLLAANGSRTFYPYVNVPAGLPADTYQILANIIPVQALPESQTDNNQASQTALGATQTVTAVPPFVDLTGQFSPTMKLPATDTSGDGKLIYVPVVVKNIGNVALPALQKINIEIDASCDGTVTPLKTLTAQYVGSLGAGASRTYGTYVTLPAGLATGMYNLVAVVDSSDAVAGDTNRDNNTVTSAGEIAVTQGYVDVTGVLGTYWTLPSAVVGGRSLAGTTSVVVKNLGNIALPAGQLVNIQIVAQDMTNPSNPDITLTTLKNQSVSSLAANGSRTFYPYVNVPAGLPVDTYQILANIIQVQALTESADNQQVSQTALGATKAVTTVLPFVDLWAQFGAMTLPASDVSGDGKVITVPVVVKNVGNVALPVGQKINIEIDASLGGVPTAIKTLAAESVSGLASGASATFTTTVTLPQSLVTGAYNLVAIADSSDLVTGDPDRSNNTATTAGTIAVTQGLADLSASTLGTSTLPSSTTANHALTGSVLVVVKNTGNMPLPVGQMVTIQLVAYDTTNSANSPITLATTGSLSISGPVVGATRSFSVAVKLPAGLPSDSYQIEAIVTPVANQGEFTASAYTVLTKALGNPLMITVASYVGGTVPFQYQMINATGGGDDKLGADITGDGLNDIIVGATGILAWYKNPDWTQTVIATSNAQYIIDGECQVADINGDGSPDIVGSIMTSDGTHEVVWFQNPRPGGDPSVGSQWVMHVIGTCSAWAHDFQIADFDNDGRLDVACGCIDGSSMIFFQTAPNVWQKTVMNIPTCLIGNDEGFSSGDVDGDGNVDLIVSGAWVRNPGGLAARNAANWTLYNIGDYNQSYHAIVVDLTGDGVNDVLFSCPHGTAPVVWFSPDTSDYTGTWTQHVLTNLDYVSTLQVGDIDGDGTPDVLVGQWSTAPAPTMAIFHNIGGTAANWQEQVIANTATENSALIDLNNDGILDIVGSDYNYNNSPTCSLELWLNQM